MPDARAAVAHGPVDVLADLEEVEGSAGQGGGEGGDLGLDVVVSAEVLVARRELDSLHLLGRDVEHPGVEEREEVEEELPGDPAVGEAEERVESRLLGPWPTAGKLTWISDVVATLKTDPFESISIFRYIYISQL